jgi:carbonic anhydrase/acetyltransferase-like protein (isoleucine patch superfamily)
MTTTLKDHGFEKNPYNPHAWIRGKPNIGNDVWIGPFTTIDAEHASVTIGKGCNISVGAQILSHSTVHRCVSEKKYNTIDATDTVIEDYCFIGVNAVVLRGCHIGHHSIVAAGAVLTEHTKIPPFSVVAGIPGKVIGSSKKYYRAR